MFISKHITVDISMSKINEDYKSNTLKYCNSKGTLRNGSTNLKNWDDRFFDTYFEMENIPSNEVSRFKQTVTNYMVIGIRFSLAESINFKNGSWSVTKIGNIYIFVLFNQLIVN